ncbi:hypothetical protein [Lactobacillus jensenii]
MIKTLMKSIRQYRKESILYDIRNCRSFHRNVYSLRYGMAN